MNRAIKFRVWNKIDKIMISQNSVVCIHFNTEFLELYANPHILNFDQVELMQFTDLLDKNGTEIYEGDIIDIGASKADRNFYLIQYKLDRFKMVMVQENFSLYLGVYHKRGEIIGNIFENPGLINETD
jgi:uncharacterized phage protein (TIGR01671 family)